MMLEVFIALGCLAGGIMLARALSFRRRRQALVARLSAFFSQAPEKQTLLVKLPGATLPQWVLRLVPGLAGMSTLLSQAGLPRRPFQFVLAEALLFCLPAAAAAIAGLDLLAGLAAGLLLAALPSACVIIRAGRRRLKFSEQLPDAIDIMVSVLKSGHSVPQAVKAIADEMPNPVGSEFSEVVHRMSLGQPLSQALSYSAERFRSYELDLILRAVAIQSEVGGSLADLLEKTNWTLRQRLKLVRQVRVLTAQSRLTAVIVACLPFLLAAVLNYMSPGYLRPLVETELGRLLLVLSVVFQLAGVLIMKRLTTMRV